MKSLTAIAALLIVASSATDSVQATPNVFSNSVSLIKRRQSYADFLDCGTDLLKITDGKDTKTLKCKMKSTPSGPVTIYFEGPGLKFKDCKISFTQQDWNTPKDVLVNVVPSLETSKTVRTEIKFAADVPKDPYHKKVDRVLVERQTREAAKCTISGDPHIMTFGASSLHKITLDYQGEGQYIIVDSQAGLRILGSYFKCGTKNRFTCLGGVSVQYGNSGLLYTVEKPEQDGKKAPDLRSLPSTDMRDIKYTLSTDKRVLNIELEKGSTITVSTGLTGTMALMVILSAVHYNKVEGQCGNWNDDPECPLVCKNHKWERFNADKSVNKNNVKAWGDCWKVPDEHNCFRNGRLPPVQSNHYDYNLKVCKIPDISNPPPETPYSPPEQPPTYNNCEYNYGGQNCPGTQTITQVAPPASSTEAKPPFHATTTKTAGSTTTKAVPPASSIVTTVKPGASTSASATTIVTPPKTNTEAKPSNSVPSTAISTDEYKPPVTTEIGGYGDQEEEPGCPESFIKEARDVCTKLINSVIGCDKICPTEKQVAIDNCIADATSICNYALCEDHKQFYLTTCKTVINYQLNSTDSNVVTYAAQVQEHNGFDGYSCNNNCTSPQQGTCTPTGCRCVNGFSGIACKIDLKQYKAYEGETILSASGQPIDNTLTQNLIAKEASNSASKQISSTFVIIASILITCFN